MSDDQGLAERDFTLDIIKRRRDILNAGGIDIGFPLDEELAPPLKRSIMRAIMMGLSERALRVLQILVYYGPKTRAERRELGTFGDDENLLLRHALAGRGPERICAISGSPSPTMRAEPSLRIGPLGDQGPFVQPPLLADARRFIEFLRGVQSELSKRGIADDGSSELNHTLFYLRASIDGCGVGERNSPTKRSVDATIEEVRRRAEKAGMNADKHLQILRWMKSTLERRKSLERRLVFAP